MIGQPQVMADLMQGDLENFWKRLPEVDPIFEKRRVEAAANDHVIRYVATMEERRCNVAVAEIPKDHALACTGAMDNIIRITTVRYSESPLTIQGPGAGPEVTAGGVFADIISLSFQLS